MTTLSLIVPLYNEEKHIRPLAEALAHVRDMGVSIVETLLVDDGSTDATRTLLNEYAVLFPGYGLLSHPTNLGKGSAVRTGVLAAHGDYILVMDGDLSVSLEAIPSFLSAVQHGADIAMGSRRLATSRITAPQGLMRRLLGSGFTAYANALLRLNVSDVTCGFKCFRRPAAQMLFSEARVHRWAFDAEILYLARRHGLVIREIGVSWRNHPDTKVRLARDVVGSFIDLLRIRFLHSRLSHGT